MYCRINLSLALYCSIPPLFIFLPIFATKNYCCQHFLSQPYRSEGGGQGAHERKFNGQVEEQILISHFRHQSCPVPRFFHIEYSRKFLGCVEEIKTPQNQCICLCFCGCQKFNCLSSVHESQSK